MDSFDYVIVGAGSAGSVLTNRLSENSGTSVCVLEAGPSDWHPYIHLPAGFIKTFYNTASIGVIRRTRAVDRRAGASILRAARHSADRARSTATSTIAASVRISIPGRRFGNRGWGYADVLPYFKRLERRIGEGEATYRGRDGNADRHGYRLARSPVRGLHRRRDAVSASRAIPTTTAPSRKASPTRSGRSTRDGASARRPHSCGRPCSGRMSQVRTHAHAISIILDGKRAVGVRYAKGGRGGTIVEVRARKEVILAGGTYNSPQLLQLSGIGPPSLLTSLGIEVRHESGRSGRGPAGSLRAALGRPRQEHQDHQRACARPQPGA